MDWQVGMEISDNHTGEDYSRLSDICELLNEQHETIQRQKYIIDKQEIELTKCREYEHNTKEIIKTILTIATRNGVIGKHELLKVINDD